MQIEVCWGMEVCGCMLGIRSMRVYARDGSMPRDASWGGESVRMYARDSKYADGRMLRIEVRGMRAGGGAHQ